MQKIEKELLERLNKTVYGEIYNYPQTEYLEVIDKKEKELKELRGTVEEEEVMLFGIFYLNNHIDEILHFSLCIIIRIFIKNINKIISITLIKMFVTTNVNCCTSKKYNLN